MAMRTSGRIRTHCTLIHHCLQMLTAGSPYAAGAAATPCCQTNAVHTHGGLEAREVGGRRAVGGLRRGTRRATFLCSGGEKWW
eukprot:5444928-Prymnesium_polylepis.2